MMNRAVVILALLMLLSINEAKEENSVRNKRQKDEDQSWSVPFSDSTVSTSAGGSYFPSDRTLLKRKASFVNSASKNGINVLLIQVDQMRHDMIRAIQETLPQYKEKTKVNTPNLDKLMEKGTTFIRHHTQTPICGPARATMRTGCTIQRTGIGFNTKLKEEVYTKNKRLCAKVKALTGFDQVLASRGYNCEMYGKWHLPNTLKFMKDNNTTRAIRYDAFNYETFESYAAPTNQKIKAYRECIRFFPENLRKTPTDDEQINPLSTYPYTPTRLDGRYGLPNNTLSQSEGYIIGRDSLSRNHTESYCQAVSTLVAMERLVKKDEKPWLLDSSFSPPHAPFVATPYYFDPYWKKRADFSIPPSINITHMKNTPYEPDDDPEVRDPEILKEWMVSYYALIEEVDYYVGRLLQLLEELGQTNNTLVIFTSDHGETLGAHGKKGKSVLYEEAVRVPMILSLPGQIPAGEIIDIPTSAIDLYSTILDYTGNSDLDSSDGNSLRRFIEDTNTNEEYDNEVVIAERKTVNISSTAFMVTKGDYKLMFPKLASSRELDQLYNLREDPFEMNNLLAGDKLTMSSDVIGKAEHLKALAVEWMERMDGSGNYYSDPVHNGRQGRGDITEVSARRRWKMQQFWVSDSTIQYGRTVLRDCYYVRREYLYLGNSRVQELDITDVKVTGADSDNFQVGEFTGGVVKGGEYRRVQITFQSEKSNTFKDAQVQISRFGGAVKTIKLLPNGDDLIEIHGCKQPSSCIEANDNELPNSYGKGTRFGQGDFICLGNNKFGLSDDGRIVYIDGSDIVWEQSIRNSEEVTQMYMQRGGNLVAYNGKNIVWVSGWKINDEWVAKNVRFSRLFMTETGADIKSPKGEVTWRLTV